MKTSSILFCLITMLYLSSCVDLGSVTFNEEEANWLKAHNKWDEALACSDPKKLQIKEILKAEISLSHELDSLVRSIERNYPEAGIGFSTTIKASSDRN
ncbi:MAG: hypothetical protein IPJ20_19595 [Flammeovirgaceae bacterium]|nr:hypothetical protein [Flammeovirgaceae bacterium]